MYQQSVLALGMFDGVHAGHRRLFEEAVTRARAFHCPALAFTFSNHPMTVFGGAPRLLTTLSARERLICSLGMDAVEQVPFTQELARLLPETFVTNLVQTYHPRCIVVGYNYTFGVGGSGTPETLLTLSNAYNYDLVRIPPVEHGGLPVSSTRIRQSIEAGQVASAKEMLLRPYRLTGTVIANKQNGRKLGFPTANIEPDAIRVIPKEGVYATICTLRGKQYAAMTNIGTNPTFSGEKVSIESHLIGFTGDIYGETLAVDFMERLRDEARFSSVDALKAQLEADINCVKARISLHD